MDCARGWQACTLGRRMDGAASDSGIEPSGPSSGASSGAAARGWQAAALAVVLAAAAARVHNAFAFPPLHDFDGAGHALNVFLLHQGRLPDPATWSGFHPPLFHAAGALLWHVLPPAVPVHAGLRLLSAAAGFAALAVAWRALARFAPPADAAVAIALVAGSAVFALSTSMLGNETTCVLFTTLALAALARAPAPEDPRATRHAVVTTALASGAALAKSTGLVAVGTSGLWLAWRGRRAPARALRPLALSGLVAALLLGAHYGRLLAHGGSLLAPLSGYAHSEAMRAAMAKQPPGARSLSHYLRFPRAALVAPVHDAPGMVTSVPGLLYASTWADGHARLLPAKQPQVARASALLAIGGLLPTALGCLGLRAAWRGRRRLAPAAPWLLFAALLLAGFVLQSWLLPYYSAVKASYLLPALLPFALLLALGIAALPGGVRTAVRGALLAYALAAVGVTWWGWWDEPRPAHAPAQALPAAAPGTPEAAVGAYLRALGRDPLRTLPLLTAAGHEQHGLGVGAPAAGGDAPEVRPEDRLLGWLAVQTGGPVLGLAGRLGFGATAVTAGADRAEVSLEIAGPEGLPFEQRFLLVRAGPDAPWRIDRIEQAGVVASNAIAAFAAWPNARGAAAPPAPVAR